MDIHQSQKYGQYMEKIGWRVEKVNDCQIFIRRFPLIGSLIKIQRPAWPIPFNKIKEIAKKYQAFKIVVQSEAKSLLRWWPRNAGTPRTVGRSTISQIVRQFKKFGYIKSPSPYLPTKTIHLDLTQSEEKILAQMKKKTRYCLRRAQESQLIVNESKDIGSFIKLKSRQFFPLGFLIRKDINALWQTFSPKNACLLLAFDANNSHPLAGILLLFHQKTSHYWLAASTKKGNQFFAPTLLVWKALKISKKKRCKIFDFEGIYDSRFHQATKSWQGFTRFKKGFGGKEVDYPPPFMKFFARPLDSFFSLISVLLHGKLQQNDQ